MKIIFSNFSLYLKVQILKDDDIKLSERLFIPSKKLRGFERGKVGPKDGNDFIGGNYVISIKFFINITTNIRKFSKY